MSVKSVTTRVTQGTSRLAFTCVAEISIFRVGDAGKLSVQPANDSTLRALRAKIWSLLTVRATGEIGVAAPSLVVEVSERVTMQ